MARANRGNKKLSRKSSSLDPKLTIYALCEGKNSEPDYLLDFCKLHGNGMVSVIPSRAMGVPSTIVELAVKEIGQLKKYAKKSKDPLDLQFEVWAIFDRDDHPKVNESITRAKQHNIQVAYSNPCFELWALLHFDDHRQHLHRHPLQSKLEGVLQGYDSKKSKKICAKLMDEHYDKARARAINLEKEHNKVGDSKVNPYTDIYILLDKIKSNGNRNKIK
jgi:hypothetical protein